MNRSMAGRWASVPVLMVGAALTVALAGCGGGSSSTAAAVTTTTSAPTAARPAGSAGSGTFPGTSGSVAAISGSSMEVQNAQAGQVTVSWTKSTAFTETVTLRSSAVVAGDCVSAIGTLTKGTVQARTVTVSRPSAGRCGVSGRFGGDFGGRSGARGNGGTTRPTGSVPSGTARPGGSGSRRGFAGGGNFAVASGKVTSVSKGVLVISGFSTSAATQRPATGTKTKPSLKTATVKVAVTSSTAYSETKSAKSSSLAVGDCVTASGKTNSIGAVKASTVRITSTGHKTCSTGFAGGFGAGAAGGGAAGGGSAGA